MARITRVLPDYSADELRTLLKSTTDRSTAQKLLVILNAAVDPRTAEEIALHPECPFTAFTDGSRPTTPWALKASWGLEKGDAEMSI